MFQFRIKQRHLSVACSALLAIGVGAGGAMAKGQTQKWKKLSGTVDKVKITLFSAPTNNTGIFRIATGSDGNLWFGESNPNENPNAVIKFTTKGTATAYNPEAGARPEGLALGADGNIWFAEFTNDKIDRITPNGKITPFTVAALNGAASESCGFALGANGDIYFATDNDGVGYITTKGKSGLISTGDNGAQPVGLTLGPDGNIWFIDVSGPYIGKIMPNGQFTDYNSGIGGGANWGIASGADGRIWYTNEAAAQVVAINVDGTGLSAYTVTHQDGTAGTPDMIVAGPDGNLYVGEADGYIDKVTTSGVVTTYELPGNPSTNFVINGMTVGPDGNIWFANDVAAQVGVYTLSK
jgi:streptogramin lyase